MKTVGLPGRDPATGPWLEMLLAGVSGSGDGFFVQLYRDWDDPQARLDLEHEIEEAARQDASLVVAKSIGTVIALRGIARGSLAPQETVLIGLPLTGFHEEQRDALRTLCEGPIPTLLIQQIADPLGSFADLHDLVPQSETTLVIGIEGDDHRYADVEGLIEIIRDWRAGELGA